MKTFVICSILLALAVCVQNVPIDADGPGNVFAGQDVYILPHEAPDMTPAIHIIPVGGTDGPGRIGVGFCIHHMCQNTCVNLGFKIGICSPNGATCTCYR